MRSTFDDGQNAQLETAQPLAKRRRGFASMSPEKRRAIAANGGRALRPEMRAFSKNRDLAAAAGRKGGAAVRQPRASLQSEARDV